MACFFGFYSFPFPLSMTCLWLVTPMANNPLPTPVQRMAILSHLFILEWFPVVSPIKNIYPPPPENAEKFAFFQNIRIPVLASLSLPSGILQKAENLFSQGNRRHPKQISHLASKASLSGLFCNFSRYVKLCGGGDSSSRCSKENRNLFLSTRQV